MSKSAIYGAGAFGKSFFNALEMQIDFFIDDYYEGASYLEKPLVKLEDVAKETKIYISVLQHSQKIEDYLHSQNFTNVLSFTQSIKAIPNILEEISKTDYLWLVAQKERMLDLDKLALVNSLLTDDKSKKILKQMIKLRQTLNNSYYIDPEGVEYFADDVPILDNLDSVHFVDCGAYTGDTIEALMKQNKKVSATISFEPDSKNLVALNSELLLLKEKFPKTDFFVYPCGVYSKSTILNFTNSGIDSSAHFDSESTTQVSVVSLDNTILNSTINFIKMDIEGAEYEALKGAKESIQKHKPNLAICLYHKPEDLWQLPLLIHEIEPSYDMYIRVHEDMCLSTVLYCIAKK